MSDQRVTLMDLQEEAVVPTAVPSELPLEEVAKQVRHDARRESGKYLDETSVPKGGE